MNEAEYLMKNHEDRGGCYLTRLFCHYILYNVLSHIRVIIHGMLDWMMVGLRVLQKRQSPDFVSPEVGITASYDCINKQENFLA